MAKQQSSTPVVPNFRDVDKEATARAQAAIAGGKQDPLKVPKGAKVSTDKNGVEYSRWTERAVVQSAYRSVTKSKLMDATVIVKVRQSKENTGRKVFGHYYLNLTNPIEVAGHEEMNDRSNGAIISLLQATGFMPAGGALKGSLLDRMFPSKGQPGTASPLANKAVIINVVQTLGPQKDQKTKKPVLDAEGEPILERRDQIESFLPDAGAQAEPEEDGDGEEE